MSGEESKKITSIATCGVEFVSAIVVAVLIGIKLDEYLDKSPLFLIILFLFGCMAGYMNVLRHIKSEDKSKNQNK